MKISMKLTSTIPSGIREKLFTVDKILRECYGTPDLGNVSDPLEELLFLTITQRTGIQTAIKIYRNMKEHFPCLRDILNAQDSSLRELLSSGGRGNLRTRAVKEILGDVLEKVGKLSLEELRNMDFDKAFEFLLSLPWVGEKTARCVMLYSLGFGTFPADSNVIRILKRTAVLEPIIGDLHDIEHRRAQNLIAPAIPDEIARTLHVNMVVHGQEVCRERNPECEKCEIRKFCGFYRANQARDARRQSPTIVDLFCGAGGISLGFHIEGYKTLMAVDNYSPAIKTYRLNHPWVEEKRTICSDIQKLSDEEILALVGNEKVDVLVAGVPCQGYSRVGYRTKPGLSKEIDYNPEKDPRNLLFGEVMRVAQIIKPSFIVIENVPDMKSAQVSHRDLNGSVVSLLKNRLRRHGYNSEVISLDASKFGVPQKRRRLFFVAGKKHLPDDLKGELSRVAKDMGLGDSIPTLADAICDLPLVKAGESERIVSWGREQGSKNGFYDSFVRTNTRILYDHIARAHNADDMKIIKALKQGEDYATLLKRNPEVVMGRKHKTYNTDNFHDKFFRLRWDAPSRTIVSHLAKDGNSFIHPDQKRSLTVREAARIQSFPDDFIFWGSRTAQFIQIGNAVPPLLARIFARFFRQILEGRA